MDGDWPQFLGDDMARRFGGVGIGMEGANGGTQPCRPNCSFTSPDEPSWTAPEGTSRMVSILANYNRHVDDALANSTPVSGSVAGAQTFIREPIVGPAVTALFLGGQHIGARLMRSSDSPWMVGNTIRTVVGVIRIGNVLFNGTPGEGFPAIRTGVDDAVAAAGGGPEPVVIQLGLANDQLGYLIAPATYVPVIAAEVPVNDNIIFNVSPTIGDHVMCADIALAHAVAGTDWAVTDPAECAPYDTADTAQAAAGDPVSQVPVGGVRLP